MQGKPAKELAIHLKHCTQQAAKRNNANVKSLFKGDAFAAFSGRTLAVINILKQMNPFCKPIIILVLGLLMKGSLNGQNSQYSSLNFTITERILPGGTKYEYEYWNGQLSVYEVSQVSVIVYDNLLKEPSRKTGEFKIKLKRLQILTIDSIVDKIDPIKLDTIYSTAMIDGVNWTFNFEINGKKKKIFIDNYYLSKLDPLLNYLNEILPRDKRLINFDFVSKRTN